MDGNVILGTVGKLIHLASGLGLAIAAECEEHSLRAYMLISFLRDWTGTRNDGADFKELAKASRILAEFKSVVSPL